MGMSNCSGPCEFCVNNGHCLVGLGYDDFQFDEEKFKSITKNLSNTYVFMPVRRELRLAQEKEENNMTEWLPCVVSDNIWSVNDCIFKGAHIYRIFNDKFDVKANMTINYLGYYMIGLHLIDENADISNIEIDESTRVCLTSSENDPGTLVIKQKLSFNKELTSGCLYRVVDSALNFKYLMYIRCFNGGYIEADIMKLTIHEEKCSKIKTEHRQLSVIDLKGLMFSKMPLGEGCNLKLG